MRTKRTQSGSAHGVWLKSRNKGLHINPMWAKLTLVRGALLLTFILSWAGGSGCARVSATQVLAASDLAADNLAQEWSRAVDAQIDSCRSRLGPVSSPPQRRACMGIFGPESTEKVRTGVAVLVATQTAVKEAAQCQDFPKCSKDIDWRALAKNIRAAWDSLRPYVELARAANGAEWK